MVCVTKLPHKTFHTIIYCHQKTKDYKLIMLLRLLYRWINKLANICDFILAHDNLHMWRGNMFVQQWTGRTNHWLHMFRFSLRTTSWSSKLQRKVPVVLEVFLIYTLRTLLWSNPRATSHKSQELWPWNCERPNKSVQRPSLDTSNIM